MRKKNPNKQESKHNRRSLQRKPKLQKSQVSEENQRSLAIPMPQSELDALAESLSKGEGGDPTQALAKIFAMAMEQLTQQLRESLLSFSAAPDEAQIQELSPLLTQVLGFFPQLTSDKLALFSENLVHKLDDFSSQLQNQFKSTTANESEPQTEISKLNPSALKISQERLLTAYKTAISQKPDNTDPQRFRLRLAEPSNRELSFSFGETKIEKNQEAKDSSGILATEPSPPALLDATVQALEEIESRVPEDKNQGLQNDNLAVDSMKAVHFETESLEQGARGLQSALQDMGELMHGVIQEIAQQSLTAYSADTDNVALDADLRFEGSFEEDPSLMDFLDELNATQEMDERAEEPTNAELAEAISRLVEGMETK